MPNTHLKEVDTNAEIAIEFWVKFTRPKFCIKVTDAQRRNQLRVIMKDLTNLVENFIETTVSQNEDGVEIFHIQIKTHSDRQILSNAVEETKKRLSSQSIHQAIVNGTGLRGELIQVSTNKIEG